MSKLQAVSKIGGAASKELGMGQAPQDLYGSDLDQAFAMECAAACAPANAKENITEVARWEIQIPIADANVATTFGKTMDVWGTKDAQPPPGVAAAQNTLGTPGLLPGDTIIFGWRIRVLTDMESRRIPGNLFTPAAGVLTLPASPDVWTSNDLARALNVPAGQQFLPAEYLVGLPGWRFAYNFVQGYEAVWLINHQEQLWKEPLTQCAMVEPFAEAEAAGTSFTTSQDAIRDLNDRMAALGLPQIFLPQKFTRTGSITDGAGLNAGLFAPTRADDSAATTFGGVGVPQDALMKKPYMFSQPIFWPRGQPMQFQFQQNANTLYQARMQRWLSVTGGVGGIAGNDLNLAISATLAGIMPSAIGGDIALEQTDDVLLPQLIGQQLQTNEALLKLATPNIEVGLIGKRVPQSWKRAVARAIEKRVLQVPVGWGDLPVNAG